MNSAPRWRLGPKLKTSPPRNSMSARKESVPWQPRVRLATGYRRQVRCGILQRLNPRLVVVREDRGQLRGRYGPVPKLQLPVSMQDLLHVALELVPASLLRILDDVRLDRLCAKDLGNRPSRQVAQARVPGRFRTRLRQPLIPVDLFLGQLPAFADKRPGCDLRVMGMSPPYATSPRIVTLIWNRSTGSAW